MRCLELAVRNHFPMHDPSECGPVAWFPSLKTGVLSDENLHETPPSSSRGNGGGAVRWTRNVETTCWFNMGDDFYFELPVGWQLS